jgi:hypothetical protein
MLAPSDVGGDDGDRFRLPGLDNKLTHLEARKDCLVCGSPDVDDTERAFLLIEVPPDKPIWRDVTTGLFGGARVCNDCGYVHLHVEASVQKWTGEGPHVTR